MKATSTAFLCFLVLFSEGHSSHSFLSHQNEQMTAVRTIVNVMSQQSDQPVIHSLHHMVDVVANTLNHTTQYFASRPETLTWLNYCFRMNATSGTSQCDLSNALNSVFMSIMDQGVEKALIQPIEYSGHGSRPMAPGIGAGAITLRSGSFESDLRMARGVLFAILGFAMIFPQRSDEDNTERLQAMTQSTGSHPPLHHMIKKWKTIKAVFPTFNRWYEVYSHPVSRVGFRGPSVVCRDWLPYFFPGITDEAISKDAKWTDIEEIYEPNMVSPSLSAMAKAADTASSHWHFTSKIQGHVSSKGVLDAHGQRRENVRLDVNEQNNEGDDEDKDKYVKEKDKLIYRPPSAPKLKIPESKDAREAHAFSQWLANHKTLNPTAPLKKMSDDSKTLKALREEFQKTAGSAGPVTPSQYHSSDYDTEVMIEISDLCDDAQANLSELKEIFMLTGLGNPDDVAAACEEVKAGKLGHSEQDDSEDESLDDMERHFGLPQHYLEQILVQYIHDGRADVSTLPYGDRIRESDVNTWARWWSFKFSLRQSKIKQEQYWMSPGPNRRLKYVFDDVQFGSEDSTSTSGAGPMSEERMLGFSSREGSADTTESSPSHFLLPIEDVKMCWDIMQTALITQPIADAETLFSNTRAKISLYANYIAILASLSLFVITIISYSSKSIPESEQWDEECVPPRLPTVAHVTCTEGFKVGTECWLTCMNGKIPVDDSGRPQPLIATCVGGGLWIPDVFTTVKCDGPTDRFIQSSYGL